MIIPGSNISPNPTIPHYNLYERGTSSFIGKLIFLPTYTMTDY